MEEILFPTVFHLSALYLGGYASVHLRTSFERQNLDTGSSRSLLLQSDYR